MESRPSGDPVQRGKKNRPRSDSEPEFYIFPRISDLRNEASNKVLPPLYSVPFAASNNDATNKI